MTSYCDAHIHLFYANEPFFDKNEQYFCVTSCHSKEEFESFGRYSQVASSQATCESGVPPFANAHCQQAGNFGATYPTAETFPRQNLRFWRDSLKNCLTVFDPAGRSLPTADASPRQNRRFCRDSLKTCLASFDPAGRSLPTAYASYGIHPQIVTPSYLKNDFPTELSYLESLLDEKKLIAIGECGFDFFTPEFKAAATEQEIVFKEQLRLAQKYGVPLLFHLRKSIEKIFSYSGELKKLPSVIFHSFPGTFREAESLKKHGINAFFSFGKPILNGKKSAIECVEKLPLQNLLFETDAPYQTLKGEKETLPGDIKKVYQRACELRKISLEEMTESILENFMRAYFQS
ncbi:TatD family hydrolase [uncultured Treponema sp.]|uniref:TatD family hydrolase n=1 Tax=uncultured Treponema sp. TaxID=162155 RepID=UPI00262CF263|nr:TatD family hydrolase [uncultured Treponema sp.]